MEPAVDRNALWLPPALDRGQIVQEAVLHRLARLDVGRLYAPGLGPLRQSLRDELGALVEPPRMASDSP